MGSNKFEEIKVGDIIEGVDGPVTRQAINRYAETSGDRNPIHTTYSVAMAAGLKGVIQHGLFSMAWLLKTLTSWMGNNGKLKSIDIQFRAMVRPNDIVHSMGTVIKKYQEDGQNLIDLELNQEAWSLLCKGRLQSFDKSITPEILSQKLLNNKLILEIKAEIADGIVKEVEKEKFELSSADIKVNPNFLSFGEAFIRGWYQKGDNLRVKLDQSSETGKFDFEIHKVTDSIKGTSTIILL
ncbi:MAG TPA: MaoC/PaaZ C-terminal domain-containing protein [Candidatus Deferrimicrobium sp.]|nr:MaoC/PaaZ C-terminal domain-containing protein [Candidatus Deferrimicrobium sp.]